MGLTDEQAADRFVSQISRNWREAGLDAGDQALCQYAEKLTLTPAEMTGDDINGLRELGFDDRAIHDATQVIAYFNYINRIADGLHVDQEEFVRPWEQVAEAG